MRIQHWDKHHSRKGFSIMLARKKNQLAIIWMIWPGTDVISEIACQTPLSWTHGSYSGNLLLCQIVSLKWHDTFQSCSTSPFKEKLLVENTSIVIIFHCVENMKDSVLITIRIFWMENKKHLWWPQFRESILYCYDASICWEYK